MSRRSGRSKPTADNKQTEAYNAADLDEQSEITRCVCGQDEIASVSLALQQLLLRKYNIKLDNGLFIQCDQCSVWQHGYCVGLFVDDDVPDKYWCEECKPELHRIITDSEGNTVRTLYRSVNDDRADLIAFSEATADNAETGLQESASVRPEVAGDADVNEPGSDQFDGEDKSEKSGKPMSRSRSRRSPYSAAENNSSSRDSDTSVSTSSNRQTRKDRRHGEDAFDEQLQRALRESARTSTEHKSPAGVPAANGKRSRGEESEVDVNESTHDDDSESRPSRREVKSRSKATAKSSRSRTTAKPSAGSTSKSESSDPALSKEALLSQPSQPRFVNDKSTIYELRKRTGAILEWLGRSQMELEEERDTKTLQFKEANVEGAGLTVSVNENLRLMENLTEKILSWEQKFGKYAP